MNGIICKAHGLTADHVSRLATLVDAKLGVVLADVVAGKATLAESAEWYELRGLIARMGEAAPAKTTRTRKPKSPKVAE
jgi:hypothetical protein